MQNLSAADFFKPTPYNKDTKNQIWMSMIADGHDIICHCNHPFAHLLASIFPPGHQDRDLTINQIIQRDYTETCHSGGTEERSGGGEAAAGPSIKTEEHTREEESPEDEFTERNIEELIAAAEDASKR